MKLAILFIIFFFFGIFGVVGYKIITSKDTTLISDNPIIENTKPSDEFQIKDPPKNANKGDIIKTSGDVFITHRLATQEAKLIDKTQIMQGESIRTGENANLSVSFADQAEVILKPKTQIDFVQTLPDTFLVNIASGSAEITKLNKPVSIRVMHLLVRQNEGKMVVEIDKDTNFISLDVVTGSITTSYNNLNLVSFVNDFGTGKYVFNDVVRNFESE